MPASFPAGFIVVDKPTGQTSFAMVSMLRRLTEGPRPSFPPSARDAIILGGSILDLLDHTVGRHACDLLVARLPKSGPATALENAFGAAVGEIEPAWRDHVEMLAGAGPPPRERLGDPSLL